MVNPQPAPEEYERKGWWARFKDTILGTEEPDEEMEMLAGTDLSAGMGKTNHSSVAGKNPNPASGGQS